MGQKGGEGGAEGARRERGGDAGGAEQTVRCGGAMCLLGQLFRLLSRGEHAYTYPGRVARAFCGKTAARALAKQRE